jgi:hypothetical protein
LDFSVLDTTSVLGCVIIRGYKNLEIQKLLHQEMLKGNIDVWEFMLLHGSVMVAVDNEKYQDRIKLITEHCLGSTVYHASKLYMINPEPKSLRKINSQRRKYGFKTLAKDYEKFIWMSKNDKFCFKQPFIYYVTSMNYNFPCSSYVQIPSKLLGYKFKKRIGLK